MILLTSYGEIREERFDEALAACEKMREGARQKPGCLRFDFFFHRDEPRRFVFVEEWESMDAMNAHTAQPDFGEFMAVMKPSLSGPLEPRIFEANLLFH